MLTQSRICASAATSLTVIPAAVEAVIMVLMQAAVAAESEISVRTRVLLRQRQAVLAAETRLCTRVNPRAAATPNERLCGPTQKKVMWTSTYCSNVTNGATRENILKAGMGCYGEKIYDFVFMNCYYHYHYYEK